LSTEIHLYDFDGTLFRSPEDPDWWDNVSSKNWWSHSFSLDEPCVPRQPKGDWWIHRTVNEAKQSISDPNVWAVLCTGRKERTHSRFRVPELLKMKGLNFDEVHLSPGGSTKSYKIGVLNRLLAQHPTVDTIHIWEDRPDNMKAMVSLITKKGLLAVAHPVKAPPHEIACDVSDVAGRVASRYIRRAIDPHDLG